MKYFIPMLMIFSILVSILFFPHIPPQLTNADYVDAIVGEASNQTEDTMVCIAHGLRNRGNLHGVYGYHAKHNKTESKATWAKAAIAWDLSKYEPDNVLGAKNFGTEEDIEESDNPDIEIKKQCGDFLFY